MVYAGARELLATRKWRRVPGQGTLRRTGDYGGELCTVTGMDGCDETSTIALMERRLLII
jgi:hypothetical protein